MSLNGFFEGEVTSYRLIMQVNQEQKASNNFALYFGIVMIFFVLSMVVLMFVFLERGESIRASRVDIGAWSIYGIVGDDTYEYRGIPYALPPVNNLRWAPPVPQTYDVEHSLQADTWAASCTQAQKNIHDTPEHEDCLYLNVFVPMHRSDSSQPLPVMIYNHDTDAASPWNKRKSQ